MVEAGPERIVAEMLVREEVCTLGNTLHGGAMMSLADMTGATGATGAFLMWPRG